MVKLMKNPVPAPPVTTIQVYYIAAASELAMNRTAQALLARPPSGPFAVGFEMALTGIANVADTLAVGLRSALDPIPFLTAHLAHAFNAMPLFRDLLPLTRRYRVNRFALVVTGRLIPAVFQDAQPRPGSIHRLSLTGTGQEVKPQIEFLT
jgi:hypothetical protein